MATENKKMKDPAEAALTAVEQALNLDEVVNLRASERFDASKPDDPKLPDIDDHDFTRGAFADVEANAPKDRYNPRDLDDNQRSGFIAPDRAAVANDDRQNVGTMLQALQVRPSGRGYNVATLLSLLWIAGGAFSLYSQGITTPEQFLAAYTPAQLSVAALVLFAPIVLFYIAAMLTVRSQEMKQVARAVGEVAVRLAQPENFSTDAVLSVSQAVRREIAAVGDGVERALARAGELETLVRSEISTLERAYSDNEIRIRSLIDELVTQRESIVTNAERVRTAITGSHQHLTQDLDEAAERVVNAISGAGERVTGSLEQRGEQITQALGRAGERVVEEMAGRGVELVDRLTGASDEIKVGISEAGTTITAALENKAQDITGAFERTGDLLNRHLQDGAGQVTRMLAETGRGVIDTLAQQGADVREAFEQTAKSLEDSFAQRGTEITERLTATSEQITGDFSARAIDMREQLVNAGATIVQDIASNGDTMREAFATTATTLIDELASRSGTLREQLASTGVEVVDEIVVRGSEFRERLAATAMEVTREIAARGTEVREHLEGAVRLADESIGTRVEDLAARLEFRQPARQPNG